MCLYFGEPEPILEGYAYADMAGDLNGRKSTFGFLFTFCRGASVLIIKIAKVYCFIHH